MKKQSWPERRHLTAQAAALLNSKDRLHDLLADNGYDRDPLFRQGFAAPTKAKREKANAKLHAAWGVTAFMARRNA